MVRAETPRFLPIEEWSCSSTLVRAVLRSVAQVGPSRSPGVGKTKFI